MKYINELNLNGNIIRDIVLESNTCDSTSTSACQLFFNTSDNTFNYYNGTNLVSMYNVEELDTRVETLKEIIIDESSELLITVVDLTNTIDTVWKI